MASTFIPQRTADSLHAKTKFPRNGMATEVGHNPKDVWRVTRLHRQDPEREDHPTQKPLEIVSRMIRASCPHGGLVLDPFLGSGTTAVAALANGRRVAGFEINPEYFATMRRRIAREVSAPPCRAAAAIDISEVAQLALTHVAHR